MNEDKTIVRALQEVERHNLGGALEIARQLSELELMASAQDRLDRIGEDYERMLTYMSRWYDDPQRGELYGALLYRLWQLLADMELAYRRKNVGSYISSTAMARHINTSPDFIRSVLETFVTDLSMMSLGDNLSINDNIGSNSDGKMQLLQRHHQFVSRLFHWLWTSPQWNDSEREFYCSLLSSPTIDNDDAVTLTGAVLLGLLEHFDMNKMRTLIAVWQNAADEQVKQTALIGIMLGLPRRGFPFATMREAMDALASQDESLADEVGALQVQVLNCMNAEQDRKVIEKEIMPTLVKNRDIAMGNLGLVDDGQSSVEDILHPEKQEQLMEEMEEKAMRMMKMQQEGADIYFGGFAQSKKAPFFSEMVNWWMPFSMDHPGIPQEVRKAVSESRFMRLIIEKGPFCHSDKYSLAVMGAHVVGRLPKEIDKLAGDEAFIEAEMKGGMGNTPATVRRSYLQNLYRFYNLYGRRDDFRNPFDGLFMLNDVFSGAQWDKAKVRVGRKLMKQKRWDMLEELLRTCTAMDGEAWYMLGCALLHGSKDYGASLDAFQKALEEMPDNEKILRIRARAAFLTGDYAGAEQTYLLLFEQNEKRPTYCLNACIAMMRQDKYEEALKHLYRLDYQYEDNDDIKRHIAWAQLMVGKTDKARELFAALTEKGSSISPDCCVGLGYCHWFLHDVESAVKSFRRYCELSEVSIDDLVRRFLDDETLLVGHAIDTDEMFMMADLCRR